MTPIAARFYRSFYLTLGFACACLGYAELVFLPEMVVLAGIVGICLFIAYRVEGRWSLTIRGANILGLIITLIASAYIAYQFVRPLGTSLIDTLPWPTSLLPYLGPLLMVLIPAKLFRPKHIGDVWSLQGIGLIAVALGCALAGDPPFGMLLLGYLICFVWSTALFFYYRQSRAGLQLPEPIQPRPWLLARSGALTALAMGAAFLVFLATPRFGDASWEFTLQNNRLQTGISDERPSIDLNNKGTVSLNRDLAFEVQAFASDGATPKIDLDPTQRWRATSFDYYNNGRWENRPDPEHRDRIFQPILGMDQLEGPVAGRTNNPGANKGATLGGENSAVVPRGRSTPKLPNLGLSQVFLRFQARARNANRILAEPVFRPGAEPFPNERYVSVVSLRGDRQFPWYQSSDDYPTPPTYGVGGPLTHYMQVYLPQPGDLVSPAMQFSPGFRNHLCNLRLQTVRSWTQELVRTLVKSGAIAKSAVGTTAKPDDPIKIPPEHAEEVAKALRAFLAMSGQYSYSLNLERQDDRCDPAEDFLLNTKVGHCQRFATALVLMLRSVGIPARIVLGYRGFETDGAGAYEVLQCHAHAWVEAIIQHPAAQGQPTWHWLTLDPTPAGDDSVAGGFSFARWFESFRSSAVTFYRYFVVEYDSDQQARARNWVERIDWPATLVGPDGTQWWRPVVVVAGIVGLTVFVRRRRTPKTASAADAPTFDLYARVCDLIRRCVGLEPAVNQTPEEFARVAADRLAAQTASLSDPNLPAETVVVYYRVRFGRQDVSDTERSAMTQRIDRFEADLGRRDLRLEPGAG